MILTTSSWSNISTRAPPVMMSGVWRMIQNKLSTFNCTLWALRVQIGYRPMTSIIQWVRFSKKYSLLLFWSETKMTKMRDGSAVPFMNFYSQFAFLLKYLLCKFTGDFLHRFAVSLNIKIYFYVPAV